MAINVITDEELYNKLSLLGIKSPGVVTLSGHGLGVKWEVKEAKGQEGASTTKHGRSPAKFTASHSLVYDPIDGVDEHTEWNAYVFLLQQTIVGAMPVAFDIYHPDLAALLIKSVVVEKIHGLAYDGKGGAVGKIDFIEYMPPKPKPSGNPSGSRDDGKLPGGQYDRSTPDPNEQARQELEELLEEAKKP